MKKKKVLIVLLLSTFWIHAGAQFSKQLTSEEQSLYQNRQIELEPKISQIKDRFFSNFVINDKYKEELTSILKYYSTLKLLHKYDINEDENASDRTKVFFQEYKKDVTKMLYLNGYKISTENFQLVSYLRKKLNLTEENLRELANKAVDISNFHFPNEEERWNTEFNYLSEILTNEQMDCFLREKNATNIQKKTDTAWALLHNTGNYNMPKDSIRICSRVYSYYAKRNIADELYKNNPILKREVYENITKFSPAIIATLESLQRKQKGNQIKNSSSKKPASAIDPQREQYIWSLHSNNQALEKDIKIQKIIMHILGANGRIERDNSFKLLMNYAEKENNATAMNALALMFFKGYGIKPDTINALNWWEKAGKNGCTDAYNNLGLFYKYEDNYRDQEKAFHYFSVSAQKGNINGSYFAGYMLYKGIGCKQSYEKAIEHFKIGVNNAYAPSLYMLGLCYRNGYGVEQNENTGLLFLKQAAAKSYKQAIKELELKIPENHISIIRSRSKMISVSPPLEYTPLRKTAKSINSIDSGEYQGFLITYDWSGKYIVEEMPLTLAISSHDNQIEGTWVEDNKEPISISAYIENSKLKFNNNLHREIGQYKNMTISVSLQEADIQIIKGENDVSLLGTLQFCSIQTKEKGRPMYLSVTKKERSLYKNETVIAYPNPFSNELNLYIDMEKEDHAEVVIYDMQGHIIYQQHIGKLSVGKQHIAIQPNLTKGNYVTKLFIGKQEHQLIIISK